MKQDKYLITGNDISTMGLTLRPGKLDLSGRKFCTINEVIENYYATVDGLSSIDNNRYVTYDKIKSALVLELNPHDSTISASGTGNQRVDIHTNVESEDEVSVSIDGDFKVSRSGYTVNISAIGNNTTPNTKTGVLTVTAGLNNMLTKTLAVTQPAGTRELVITPNVSGTPISEEGGVATISVVYDIYWNKILTSSGNILTGVTIDPIGDNPFTIGSESNGVIQIIADVNKSNTSQECTYSISKVGYTSATCYVKQEAGAIEYGSWAVTSLSASDGSSTSSMLPASGGSSVIVANISRSWNWKGSTDGGTETSVANPSLVGTSDGFSISGNVVTASDRGTISGDRRSISITGSYNGTSSTITIYQEPNEVISHGDWLVNIDSDKFVVTDCPASGGSATITSSAARSRSYTSGGTDIETGTPTISKNQNFLTISGNIVTFDSRGITIGDRRGATVTASIDNVSNSVTLWQESNYVTDISSVTAGEFSYKTASANDTYEDIDTNNSDSYSLRYLSGSIGDKNTPPNSMYGSVVKSVTYSLKSSQNGFTGVDVTSGRITVAHRGTTEGESRNSDIVTKLVTYYYSPSAGYDYGNTGSISKSDSTTSICIQEANVATSKSTNDSWFVDLSVESNSISASGGTATLVYSAGHKKHSWYDYTSGESSVVTTVDVNDEVIISGSGTRFTRDGNLITHDHMGVNVTTDTVTYTATNSNNSSCHKSVVLSATNSVVVTEVIETGNTTGGYWASITADRYTSEDTAAEPNAGQTANLTYSAGHVAYNYKIERTTYISGSHVDSGKIPTTTEDVTDQCTVTSSSGLWSRSGNIVTSSANRSTTVSTGTFICTNNNDSSATSTVTLYIKPDYVTSYGECGSKVYGSKSYSAEYDSDYYAEISVNSESCIPASGGTRILVPSAGHIHHKPWSRSWTTSKTAYWKSGDETSVQCDSGTESGDDTSAVSDRYEISWPTTAGFTLDVVTVTAENRLKTIGDARSVVYTIINASKNSVTNTIEVCQDANTVGDWVTGEWGNWSDTGNSCTSVDSNYTVTITSSKSSLSCCGDTANLTVVASHTRQDRKEQIRYRTDVRTYSSGETDSSTSSETRCANDGNSYGVSDTATITGEATGFTRNGNSVTVDRNIGVSTRSVTYTATHDSYPSATDTITLSQGTGCLASLVEPSICSFSKATDTIPQGGGSVSATLITDSPSYSFGGRGSVGMSHSVSGNIVTVTAISNTSESNRKYTVTATCDNYIVDPCS